MSTLTSSFLNEIKPDGVSYPKNVASAAVDDDDDDDDEDITRC